MAVDHDGPAFHNDGSNVVNQAGGQTFNGGQTNNYYSLPNEEYRKYLTIPDEEKYRKCLASLKCPEDPDRVKLRLKLSKGEVLRDVISWVLEHSQMRRWIEVDQIALLWVRGGAGKGKTMISIGLVEELMKDPSSTVLYFFCQNADQDLNTAESIVKGLMQRLFEERPECRSALRSLWDDHKNCPREQSMPLSELWFIFHGMLRECERERGQTYIVVDALDECQAAGLQEFLGMVAQHGMSWRKVKWLFTSRPQHETEDIVFPGSHDREQLSLDLESVQIAEAISLYVSIRVDKLARHRRYSPSLKQAIYDQVIHKAGGTFLWASLVCQELETTPNGSALATIDTLPPGLPEYYDRIFRELAQGETDLVDPRMRLLKTMLLALRPLQLDELKSILIDADAATLTEDIDLCASFLRRRSESRESPEYVEFVHESAREYLASIHITGHDISNAFMQYGHADITVHALEFLTQHLMVNIFKVPWPASEHNIREPYQRAQESASVSPLRYAATAWAHHFCKAYSSDTTRPAPQLSVRIVNFLLDRVMEWFEYLGWCNDLRTGIAALRRIESFAKGLQPDVNECLAPIAKDALRIALRHFRAISEWPLEAYGSALIFTPGRSLVGARNEHKIPKWMPRLTRKEQDWTSLLQTLEGHSEPVCALAYAPGGRMLASASGSGMIRISDTKSGDLLLKLTIPSGLHSVAYAPDGLTLATGSANGKVQIWDSRNGSFMGEYESEDLEGAIIAIAYASDGLTVAMGCESGRVQICDSRTRAVIQRINDPRRLKSTDLTAMAYAPDASTIALVWGDEEIHIWNTRSRRILRSLIEHTDVVTSVAYAPDSRFVASASHDCSVRLWEIDSGDSLHVFEHVNFVSAVSFAPDGSTLASGSWDHSIRVWDASSSSPALRTLKGHFLHVNAVAYSPDGRTLASASDDETVRLWDVSSEAPQTGPEGLLEKVTAVAVSPDGQTVASGSHDEKVRIWGVKSGTCLRVLDHDGPIETIAYAPDSQTLATASDSNPLQIWQVKSGKAVQTLQTLHHTACVRKIAYAPSGRSLALGLQDGTVYIWRLGSDELLLKLGCHSCCIDRLVFALNGRVLASAAEQEVWIWLVKSGEMLQKLPHDSSVMDIAFSPDGQTLASIDNGTVYIWDTFRNPTQKRSTLRRVLACEEPEPATTLPLRVNSPTGDVYKIWFSAAGTHLITNRGSVPVVPSTDDSENLRIDNCSDIFAGDDWIRTGCFPLVRLPAGSIVTCQDFQAGIFAVSNGDDTVLVVQVDLALLRRHLQGRSVVESMARTDELNVLNVETYLCARQRESPPISMTVNQTHDIDIDTGAMILAD